jgi:hypothetical protein
MTPEEQLEYERTIAQVLAIRNPARPLWREILSSSVAAALVTAIAGTLGAGILVAIYQTNARRDEQAMSDRKARAEARQHAVERALAVLAEGEYHARGMYAVTRRPFQVQSAAAFAASDLAQQRARIIGGRNDFDASWPAQKKTIAALLRQSFDAPSGVVTAWSDAASSLDRLLNGARKEYDDYLTNPASVVDKPLPPDVDAEITAKIDAFTAAVESAERPEAAKDR